MQAFRKLRPEDLVRCASVGRDPERLATRERLQREFDARHRAGEFFRRLRSLPEAAVGGRPIPLDVFDEAERLAQAFRDILNRLEPARRRCDATRDPTSAAKLAAALARLPELAETADRTLADIVESPERAVSADDLRALRGDVEGAAAMLEPSGPRPLRGKIAQAAAFIKLNPGAEGQEIADAVRMDFDYFRRAAKKLRDHGFQLPGRGSRGYYPPHM